MLRWLSHDEAAMLDGGWQEWQRQGYPVRSGMETAQSATFIPQTREDWVVCVDDVDVLRKNPDFLLLDSHSADRYLGATDTTSAEDWCLTLLLAEAL